MGFELFRLRAQVQSITYSLHSRAKDMTITIVIINSRQEIRLECGWHHAQKWWAENLEDFKNHSSWKLTLDHVGKNLGSLPPWQRRWVLCHWGRQLQLGFWVWTMEDDSWVPTMVWRSWGPTVMLRSWVLTMVLRSWVLTMEWRSWVWQWSWEVEVWPCSWKLTLDHGGRQ